MASGLNDQAADTEKWIGVLTNEDKPAHTGEVNIESLGSGWRPTMLRLESTAKEEVH
jgi:hypothetical protein